jgi:hypothetical protein
MKTKLYTLIFVLLTLSLVLTACIPPASALDQSNTPQNQGSVDTVPGAQTIEQTATSLNIPQDTSNNAPHVDVLDVTHLVIGDGKTSSSPQRGYVYSCMTQFNGKGAQGTGPWINSDGTWDLTRKLTVDGSVSWPHEFTITLQGDQRIFTGNDLPDHVTGNFPINPKDDAYQVDRNPNSIKSQSISFSVPANPALAAQPTCVGGEIGIMLSGVLIFSAFDAEGHDAAAHEVQDQCNGHPQEGGYYHYHDLSPCIPDNATGESKLLGYAFDGFGIYGPYGADGKELTNADLDECHGITSEVEWEGQKVVLYHYVATREFPYVVGCFRGTPSVHALTAPGAGQGLQSGPSQGMSQQTPGQRGSNGPQVPHNGQPPQEAINACVNQSQGASCSFTTPGGQINGACLTPPQSTQLACVPAGGPQAP